MSQAGGTLLHPYRVLDCTDERGELGPMLLGDLGADVIKVEPPGGTSARRVGPFVGSGDEDRSLSFEAFNRNKRSIVLDPDSAADRNSFERLIRESDFLFESHPHSLPSRFGISFDVAKSLNPDIVFVRLSPFGSDGPYAEFAGNDLSVAALGGPMSLQGDPNRPPIRVGVPQVWRHAGVESAAAALAAHHRRLRVGGAQFADVSAQCAMTWTMLNAMCAAAIQGFDYERVGNLFPTSANVIQLVYECADGFVLALPNSNVLRGCLPWMIELGLAEPSLLEIDWERYDETLRNPPADEFSVGDGQALLAQLFPHADKQTLFEYGIKHGLTLAPVNTLDELLALGHLEQREYWQAIELAGREIRTPGLWAKSASGALSVRRLAPAVDQHREEILAEIGASENRGETPKPDGKLPFEGIVVADFSWVGVGPISAKYLADHGARVIRIESESRPDVLRGGGPFKDAEPGLDRSHFFGEFNSSKESITLDLKQPDAIAIAKQIIERADVVIESFAPGAIERMGLGYEEIRKLNPQIVMISTCLMGQTGHAAQVAGYGYHAGAIAGFYEVTGWADLPPNGPWLAYTDTIAPRFVSLILASALDHRRRTGEGGYFDIAQLETSLHFLGPELLDLQINRYSASRDGNRMRGLAPQGAYSCSGTDQWCAIGVDTDEQWLALCEAIGRADLAARSDLADADGRVAAHEEIDDALTAWTSRHAAGDVMRALQDRGVPAGMVQRSSDLLRDPQYHHRNFHKYYEHPAMGRIPYTGHQYRIEGYDHGPRGPAPMLGQHSYDVLQGLIGLSDEEIAQAYASGAVT